jgi:RNA polymerase sigma-70 factor (family 1)
MTKDYDEQQVLQQLARGDERAFRQIYDRYWKSIYAAANRFLKSPELSKDIVQEVFSTLWAKRTEFTEVQHLRGYLITMSRNLTYKQLKKIASEWKVNSEYVLSLEQLDNTVEHPMRAQQYDGLLRDVVDRLPPQQKQVYILSRTEGLSHEIIAQQLNITRGTVKNHMMAALNFIRQRIKHIM